MRDISNNPVSESNDIDVPVSEVAESKGIWSVSFQGLLWTNWLTAINDNVFRWFVIGVGKDFVGPEQTGTILMLGTALFVLPYMLLASPAGWLADRFSKRNVIVACKVLEIAVMGVGVLALLCQSLVLLMFTVFLMGAQSALFAPAKVGKIPELLSERSISAGNGVFNLATLSATVIGMGIGGWLADQTGYQGQEKVWLTTLILIGNAVVGTLVSLVIRPLPAANQLAKFPYTIIGGTIKDILALAGSGRLFQVALGIVFFWSIAGLAQINIDAFAEESGSISESQRTPLLISLILGVGLGSVFAGFASGHRIAMGLVPWGAAGISVFCGLLFFAPEGFIDDRPFTLNKVIACCMLAGLGVSAGFYDVPLAAYLQHRSPIESRGAILSANNCLLFTGILLMSLLFGLVRTPSHPGSWENLPAPWQVSSLTPEQQAEVGLISRRFENEWGQVRARAGSRQPDAELDAPRFEQFATHLDPDSLTAGLSELVWIESQARRQLGEEVSLAKYQDRIESSEILRGRERQIKSVIRQSSRLPWLSSRQIFLLMGLMTIPVVVYFAYRHRHL